MWNRSYYSLDRRLQKKPTVSSVRTLLLHCVEQKNTAQYVKDNLHWIIFETDFHIIQTATDCPPNFGNFSKPFYVHAYVMRGSYSVDDEHWHRTPAYLWCTNRRNDVKWQKSQLVLAWNWRKASNCDIRGINAVGVTFERNRSLVLLLSFATFDYTFDLSL